MAISDMDIANTTIGDQTNTVQDVVVDSMTTDAATGSKETTYQSTTWNKNLGYYKKIPEVKIAINAFATWTVGKGWKSDGRTKVLLENLSGWGEDTFNDILKNQIRTALIDGDSFAEVIRDKETDTLINLKPLDPSTIKTVVNSQGRLIRYEQTAKTSKNVLRKYKPKQILHFMYDRIADEIHGISILESIQRIIDAEYESFSDVKELQHRYVRPRFMVELDTDNATKIAAFKTKFDESTDKAENIFFPMKTVNPQVLSVPSNSTLNPMPWREHLRNYFFQVVGIPQIILGSSGEFTESTAKIAYLAFQQTIESFQLYIEQQIWNQLFLKIELDFPASIQNELISDKQKDGANQQVGLQPNDTTAGVGA